MSAFTRKNILLGVTGGIAAYKAPDLVRRLRERGAEVQVVMSRGAQQFITPMTFQAVSGRPVASSPAIASQCSPPATSGTPSRQAA